MPEISGGPVSPVRQLPALPAGKHSAVAEAADAAAAASDRGRVSFLLIVRLSGDERPLL